MQLSLAPMEGITGYVYRNTFHRHFRCISRYYTPFLAPNQNHAFTSREKNDILPEHNEGICLIPQVLTSQPDDFLWAYRELRARGYEEVNLNLGCPSGTVVSKGKGAGFLARTDALEQFLDRIFSCTDGAVSLKTRLGLEEPEEFESLLDLFNRYPLRRLIIHPRVRTDFYRNRPRLEFFRQIYSRSLSPVVYNGDLFTSEDAGKVLSDCPGLEGLMFGRGILANPCLAEEILGGPPLEQERLRVFCQDLLDSYRAAIPEERNVLFKMKELWLYQIHLFTEHERYAKKIRKARSLAEYEAAVNALFAQQRLIPRAGYPGTP